MKNFSDVRVYHHFSLTDSEKSALFISTQIKQVCLNIFLVTGHQHKEVQDSKKVLL